MNSEAVKYRHCSRCEYKELRGSRQGAFIGGQFVCDSCYWDAQMREYQSLPPPQETPSE